MIRRTALALALLSATSAWAQAYPNKPVKLVVPYPPGGPTDIVARVIAERLQAQTGQTFVVENKAGAGGNLGAEAVARAPADGYTLLVSAGNAMSANVSLYKKLPYDPVRDFTPITRVAMVPNVLVMNAATAERLTHAVDRIRHRHAAPRVATHRRAGGQREPGEHLIGAAQEAGAVGACQARLGGSARVGPVVG